MGIKEIAEQALGVLEESKFIPSGRSVIYHAITGHLRGVAAGNITVGQGWIGELFVKNCGLEKQLDENTGKVISELFASGIFSEGQQLDSQRAKSFTERA